MRDLDAMVQGIAAKLADVGHAFDAVAEDVAMRNLPSAELWVADQPRRHYADPELITPAGTEGEHG